MDFKKRKKLENLFSWLNFYKDNLRVLDYQKCQKQINDFIEQNKDKPKVQ
jgi:hypothetical protein